MLWYRSKCHTLQHLCWVSSAVLPTYEAILYPYCLTVHRSKLDGSRLVISFSFFLYFQLLETKQNNRLVLAAAAINRNFSAGYPAALRESYATNRAERRHIDSYFVLFFHLETLFYFIFLFLKAQTSIFLSVDAIHRPYLYLFQLIYLYL